MMLLTEIVAHNDYMLHRLNPTYLMRINIIGAGGWPSVNRNGDMFVNPPVLVDESYVFQGLERVPANTVDLRHIPSNWVQRLTEGRPEPSLRTRDLRLD
jgi:hypothetical protein